MSSPEAQRSAYHGPTAAVEGRVRDYLQLLKPRVMSLVIFTAVVGMVVAPGGLHPVLAAIAVLCIAVGAGAAGALNMWYEADVDALMTRTRNRPLPAGRIVRDEALAFGAVLASGSVFVMGLAVNWVAAALLAATIGFYLFVYTMWLKRRTAQNIVIGGAAGALPPVVGWAAVTGTVSLEALILFAIIFLWTPPHFWALALCRSDDYRAAGIPMMPLVSGHSSTRRQIAAYAVLLTPFALAPWFLGYAGSAYLAVAGVLSVLFIAGSVRLIFDHSRKAAMQLFGFSIIYLFGLFAVLLAEHLAGSVA